MISYMYIDESGDLGMSGSKFLILAGLMTQKPKILDRIIKNMRRNKFKKELRKANEIKANNSSNEVRKYMLERLNNIESAKIVYVVLEKKKLYSEYLKNDKNKLYNYVAGKLARQIVLQDTDVEIRVDKSKGRQLLREDFNAHFLKNLNEKSSIRKATIEHSYSHAWSGLQFADLLAWACFQKFEHGNSEFVDVLKIEQEVYHVW